MESVSLNTPVKFEQICFVSEDSFKSAENFSKIHGLDPKKTVYDENHHAKGTYFGMACEWQLRLAYVYPMPGLEVEFLQYLRGGTFHAQLKNGELSHVGTHVESLNKFVTENPMLTEKIILQGELWKGERGWGYIYFNTSPRLKIIQRMFKKGEKA